MMLGKFLGILNTVSMVLLCACSSGNEVGYGATYGSSYGEYGYSQGSYGRELPHTPGYSVRTPTEMAENTQIINNELVTKFSRKTKDRLGHKPGPRGFGTVIIDAGHGGRDPGAVVAGISEKTLALDIARRLRSKLRGHFQAVLIRNGDYFVDLDRRVRATDRFDDAVLVSIHLNHANSRSVRGPETYYFRVDSYSLAKRMQRAMTAVSNGERSRGLVRRRLRLTRNPQIPCVLVEIGYLSNSSERKLLATTSYRDRMAEALASALKTQKRIGDSGMGKLPAPLNRPPSRSGDKSSL